MHAAYKGKADMCHLLLQHGADVNCNQHEYGYTALMFAGLSGMWLPVFYELKFGFTKSLVLCCVRLKNKIDDFFREDRHHLHDAGCRSRDRPGELCGTHCCSDGSVCRWDRQIQFVNLKL